MATPLRTVPDNTLESRVRAFFAAKAADPDAQAVAFGVFGAYEAVFSYIEGAALRPLGLTHAGFVLLMSLWSLGPVETRELARIHGVSKPAVVSAVNTLERRRFVRRVRSVVDRRLVTVELTGPGRTLVERAQKEAHNYERRLSASLTRQEQRTLVGLLGRLQAAAREASHDGTPLVRRQPRSA